MSNAVRISVVIPTYNKLPRLRLTLLSLEYQSIEHSWYEVVIVDDGSTDGTVEYCNSVQNRMNIKVISIENHGRSFARNIGVKNAEGKWIIFIDDDLILPRNFIKFHLIRLEKSGFCGIHGQIRDLTYLKFFHDPVHGERIRDYQGKDIDLSGLSEYLIREDSIVNGDISILFSQSKLSRLEKVIEIVVRDNLQDLIWLAMTGGNFSICKDIFLDLGGFDTDFGRIWGCEDFELGYRLQQEGVSFEYHTDCVNFHMTHLRKYMNNDIQLSLDVFYQKHKNPYIKDLWKLLVGEYRNVNDYIAYVKRNGG